MHKHHKTPLNHCPSCGVNYEGKFCYNCGEKVFHESDFTVKKFLAHTLDMFTHLDGKFLRSAKYIFIKPGFLTLENMHGARVKYAKPVQIFLIANVLFFLVLHFSLSTDYTPGFGDEIYGGLSAYLPFRWFAPVDLAIIKFIKNVADARFEASGMTATEFAKEFLINSRIYSKSFLILLIPMYALVIYVFNFKRFKFFSHALIFACHFTAFELIVYALRSVLIFFHLQVFKPITYLLFETNLAVINKFLFSDGFEFVNLLFWIPYFYIACRRLFPEELKVITLIKSYFIARITSFITFVVYKKLLILITLWLMH